MSLLQNKLTSPIRTIVTNEGGSRTINEAVAEIKRRMRYADEAMYVHRDGSMRRIRK